MMGKKEMNTSEIVDRYQRRHTSISVLAELNACSTKEIKDILIDAGVLRKQKEPEPVVVAPVLPKMPRKLVAAYKMVCSDIKEEIEMHKKIAAAEKKEMSAERAKVKAEISELLQQYREFETIRKNNIQIHINAIDILENELKEENEFFEMFK
jgi:DNA repair exonuclease SbcCD ATPase subunit